MAEQRLVYVFDGDASGLKKAIAEVEAANQRLTEALTRKVSDAGLLTQAKQQLPAIEAALAKARRELDFFRRSAEIAAPAGIKQFTKDIDKASAQLNKLTQQAIAQRAKITALQGALAASSAGVGAAQEQLQSAMAAKRVVALEAERQARIAEGNQVLAQLREQAAANERLAAIERKRALDEAANARAAAANARVQASRLNANVAAAQAAYRAEVSATASGLFSSIKADTLNSVGRSLGQVNARALETKQRFEQALASARNFGRGSTFGGMATQLAAIAAQVIAVRGAIQGIKSVLQTGIEQQRFQVKFLFATGDAKRAADEMKFVSDAADRLAIPLREAQDSYSDLIASTKGTAATSKDVRDIWLSVAQAGRVLQLPQERINRAFLAINQTLSKGTAQAEEIRGQLAEQIPGAFNLFAEGMAESVGETLSKTLINLNSQMKKGQIDSLGAMRIFSDKLREISSKGLFESLDSLQAKTVLLGNAWYRFKQQIAESGALEGVKQQVIELTEKLQEMGRTGEAAEIAKQLASAIGDLAKILSKSIVFIAQHGTAIKTLIALYAAFKVAKAVQGLQELVAKSAAVLGVIPGLQGGFKVLIALLGGPLGISAALAAAAGAWLLFKDTAADAVDATRGKMEGLRNSLNDAIGGFNTGKVQGVEAVEAFKFQVKKINDALVAALAQREELARKNKQISVSGFADFLLGKEADFAKEDATIRQLRADLERAGRAYGEAVKQAAALGKVHRDSPLRPGKEDKGARPDALTRLPTVGRQFDAETAALKAALDVQSGLIEASLQARLISQARYYELKRDIDNKQFDADRAALQKQLDAEEEQIAKLEAISPAKLNKNAELSDRLREARTKVRELQSQLDAIDGKQVVANVQINVQTALNKEKVQDAINQARAELAQLTGGAPSEAEQRALIAASYRDLLVQLEGDAAGVDLLNHLIDVKTWQTRLDTLQKSWQLAMQTMQNAEQSIDVQQKQGLITEADAQARIAQAHRDAGVALDALLPKMEALANSINSPEMRAAISAWKNELASVKAVIDPIAASINTDVKNSLTGFLTDIGSAAKTAREAWRDLYRNILLTVNKAASQRIVDSLFPSLTGGGGFGGVISGALGGGAQRGGSPANPVYVADINTFSAAGGANIFGGQAGGAGGFSGIWNSINESIRSIVNGISGFFSRLMSSLSGLFSGGGGGLFSAIGSLFGFAEGGWTGPGSKYQPAGIVHGDEYVFDKPATNRLGVPFLNWLHNAARSDVVSRLGESLLNNMHYIASGANIPQAPRLSYAEGGLVNLPAVNSGDVHVHVRNNNIFDTESAAGALGQTRSFERAVLNVIKFNPRIVKG